MKNKISNFASKTIKFWLPSSSFNHDTETALMAFIGIQFSTMLATIGIAYFLWIIQTLFFFKIMLSYIMLCFTSLILLKTNRPVLAQHIGAINVSLLLLAGGLLLGRTASVWVFFIGTFIGGHFFVFYSEISLDIKVLF